jgi:hypothetical protein
MSLNSSNAVSVSTEPDNTPPPRRAMPRSRTPGIGSTAWVQTKDYSTLAEAYAITEQEVALVAVRLGQVTSEEAWAQFVLEAESAISREHTMWRARRGRLARHRGGAS